MDQNRANKAAERMEKKIDLAKERDTRVVITRTADTHLMLDICRSFDKGINALRKGMIGKYPAEKVIELLNEYQEVAKAFHAVTEKICKTTGLPYQPPKAFEGKKK